MKAARLHGPRDLRVEDVPIPEIRAGWVLVEMHSIGICGTDLSVYCGDVAVRHPVILGHECAGVVVEVGPGVQDLKAGDRVFVEASWGCGDCAYCRRDLSVHCLRRSSLGRTVDGAFAEYLAVPAGVAHRMAEHVPFDDAQSSSTIACAIRAMAHVRPVPGSTAAVVGSGHAGLILQQMLRIAGVGWIAMAGSREKRLALARELGADLVVEGRSPEALRAVQSATDGLGVDLSADAAATAASLDLTMQLASLGGTVLLFGIFEGPIDHFRGQDMYRKEISLIGSRGGFGACDATARLLGRGAFRVGPLISHTFPLEGIVEGFRLMDEKAPDALRIVIHPKG